MTAFKMKGRAIEVRTFDTFNGAGALLAMIRVHRAVKITDQFVDHMTDGLTDWYESEGLMWRMVNDNAEPTAWRNLEYHSKHCPECKGNGQAPGGDVCRPCDGTGWGDRPAREKIQTIAK